MIQILYSLADTFWLGKLGKEAVSAISVSWPVIETFMMFGMGFVIAGLSLVSQYFGAGKYNKISKIIGNMYFMMFTISTLIGFIGFLFSEKILEAIKTPLDVLEYADIYMKIMLLASPLVFSGFVFSFAMRALGDMITPVKINLITVFLNVVLDPILIFGFGPIPKMDVGGAAIATVISNTIASLIGLALFLKGFHGIKLNFKDFLPDKVMIRKIFGIGIHVSFGNSLNSLGMVIMVSIVNFFGSAVVAAYGIVVRIIFTFFSISMGIGQAMATMVGQNIGANRYERVKEIVKDALYINLSVLAFSAFFVYLAKYYIVKAFISESNVIFYGEQMIKYFVFSVPFFALFGVTRDALRVSGQTKQSLLLGLFRLWVLRIPLAYLLANYLNSAIGIWIGMALSNIISGLFAMVYLTRWKWIKNLVE